jgi:beta-fructofuranosidase
MLIAARGRGAEPKDDGLIGYAWSPDGLSWEVGAPVTQAGGGFGEVEVAQVRVIDGQPILVFTCHPYQQSAARREAVGLFCTYSIAGETVFGPWDIHKAEPFRAEPSLFAAPLIQQRNGRWALVGFRNLEPEGIHAFWILDPIEVHVENGVLVGDASYVSDAPPLSGNY